MDLKTIGDSARVADFQDENCIESLDISVLLSDQSEAIVQTWNCVVTAESLVFVHNKPFFDYDSELYNDLVSIAEKCANKQ